MKNISLHDLTIQTRPKQVKHERREESAIYEWLVKRKQFRKFSVINLIDLDVLLIRSREHH